jgi:hypothetical protein
MQTHYNFNLKLSRLSTQAKPGGKSAIAATISGQSPLNAAHASISGQIPSSARFGIGDFGF